ncbi:DEAD/DEAH box helicase [Schleiferilactobacillus harbinensis]|uniref:DNA 3'-5' helicase n=1 Tax=Schleiferilactobacillus harbinensis TaxID=304207 RepID=A0A5P8M558_9LACO|nr:DEAD/DEAH box helicase [Schleiferilactobacillus harbinensis]QFR23613.1 DEAD/DEAH box helicase [Schleiferilactobacillus harbinensis]
MNLNKSSIIELIAHHHLDDPSSVVVFEGVAPDLLIDVPHKLLPTPVTDTIVDIDSTQRAVYEHAFWYREASWSWVTYEELVGIDLNGWLSPLIGEAKLTLIKNDLYNSVYPYWRPVDAVIANFNQLVEEDDSELPDRTQPIAKLFYKYYEQISKVDDHYFVKPTVMATPVQMNELSLYSDFEVNNVRVDHVYQLSSKDDAVDLTGSEDDFLRYVTKALEKRQSVPLQGYYSGAADSIQHLPFDRLHRLMIVTQVFLDQSDISVMRETVEQRPVINGAEYLRILQENWGYKQFRTLQMYSDPGTGVKDTVDVPQDRIIEDIVDQAEAALNGNSFRDVFITAPTGAGKSVMFQVPALYLLDKHPDERPLTIIISPLIGLMTDQVESMVKKGIMNAKTINSALSPFEKSQIVDDVKNNRIDLLYLSPETLQNRRDITDLIGDRKIGLLIVDEAHTVVTWGKSFRADYWYLGLYLQRLRKTYNFPIVTFTATATFGGENNMLQDISNSLNMINPITYLGNVKRDDILMLVKPIRKSEGQDALDLKTAKLLKRLSIFRKNREKTLIYFPTTKLLNSVKMALNADPAVAALTRTYYGTMFPAEKQAAYEDFASGQALFMLATKAFGMGIDIGDITNVYHYAPTGDVIDYVQEIGRVARKHEIVPYGKAYFDYLRSDFKYVNQLHGMSTIQNWQLRDAMAKILALFKQNHYNRNLVVSAADFKYVLDLDESDSDQADNKLKIILLMIEKDFTEEGNYHYAPFVARPKQAFGTELTFINEVNLEKVQKSKLGPFIKELVDLDQHKGYEHVYSFNMADFWRKYYSKDSYPAFKHQVFSRAERKKTPSLAIFNLLEFATEIAITWTAKNDLKYAQSLFGSIGATFNTFLEQHAISQKQFKVGDLCNYLFKALPIVNTRGKAQALATSLLNFANIVVQQTGTPSLVLRGQNGPQQFRVTRTFPNIESAYTQTADQVFPIDKMRTSMKVITHCQSIFDDHSTRTAMWDLSLRW